MFAVNISQFLTGIFFIILAKAIFTEVFKTYTWQADLSFTILYNYLVIVNLTHLNLLKIENLDPT